MRKTLLTLAAMLCLSGPSALAYTCELETVFTPFQNGTQAYIEYLEQNAKYTLFVSCYTMTSQPVVDEYCRLASNGVKVRVILDKSQTKSVAKEKGLIEQMRAAGVEVTVTTSPQKHAICHNKFSILDGKYVEDGSWNYTMAADNQCNSLSFNTTPCPERARAYYAAWIQIYDYAKSQESNAANDEELGSSVELHRGVGKHGKRRHRRLLFFRTRR